MFDTTSWDERQTVNPIFSVRGFRVMHTSDSEPLHSGHHDTCNTWWIITGTFLVFDEEPMRDNHYKHFECMISVMLKQQDGYNYVKPSIHFLTHSFIIRSGLTRLTIHQPSAVEIQSSLLGGTLKLVVTESACYIQFFSQIQHVQMEIQVAYMQIAKWWWMSWNHHSQTCSPSVLPWPVWICSLLWSPWTLQDIKAIQHTYVLPSVYGLAHSVNFLEMHSVRKQHDEMHLFRSSSILREQSALNCIWRILTDNALQVRTCLLYSC